MYNWPYNKGLYCHCCQLTVFLINRYTIFVFFYTDPTFFSGNVRTSYFQEEILEAQETEKSHSIAVLKKRVAHVAKFEV